jgi:hypothetical protein
MFNKSYNRTNLVKVFILFIFTWVIGTILAVWVGLAYFFLVVLVRSLIITVPPIYSKFLGKVFGDERAIEEELLIRTKNGKIIYFFRGFITIIWLFVTIYVFNHLNIRLIDYFK